MPGVLMLEAMYQASAWLVRQSEGFAHSVVILKEARNIKYADFVTPGKELVVTAEILKQDDSDDDAQDARERSTAMWPSTAAWSSSDSTWPIGIRSDETPTPICRRNRGRYSAAAWVATGQS